MVIRPDLEDRWSPFIRVVYLIGLVSAEIKLQYEYDQREDFVAYAEVYARQVNAAYADGYTKDYSSGIQNHVVYFFARN